MKEREVRREGGSGREREREGKWEREIIEKVTIKPQRKFCLPWGFI